LTAAFSIIYDFVLYSPNSRLAEHPRMRIPPPRLNPGRICRPRQGICLFRFFGVRSELLPSFSCPFTRAAESSVLRLHRAIFASKAAKRKKKAHIVDTVILVIIDSAFQKRWNFLLRRRGRRGLHAAHPIQTFTGWIPRFAGCRAFRLSADGKNHWNDQSL
jgi:hypothetical protein